MVGPTGTVVVPTQTANNSTTSRDYRAAVAGMSRRQRKRYVERLPGFHRDHTPSFRMGLLAEYVRQHPQSVRSDHPQTSFAALGPSATYLMAVHELDSHLGDRSPLAALHDVGGLALLIGVGYERCTALHLAEYRLPKTVPPAPGSTAVSSRVDVAAPQLFRSIHLDDSCFVALGRDLDQQSFVISGPVGDALARLIPIRDAVTFAVDWMARSRNPPSGH